MSHGGAKLLACSLFGSGPTTAASGSTDDHADRGSQDCSRQTAGGFQNYRRYYELAADHRLSHGDRTADSWPGPGRNPGAPNPDHVRPPDDRRAGGGNVRAAATAAVGRRKSRYAL